MSEDPIDRPDRPPAITGRGAAENPANRFDGIDYRVDDTTEELPERPATEFITDSSRSIISTNNSPDIGFDASINPYRGCEHGCIYCYARPTHEYLGYSAGLDFETRILVKRDAARLLATELRRRSWKPQPLAMSGVTDPYQPIERTLGLTRSCLEVLVEARNPVIIVTKNRLVARDIDLLGELASYQAAQVMISLPTLDAALSRVMEPRTSQPARRLEALAELTDAGIPTGVLIAPVIPGLTDHEIPQILKRAAAAGAVTAGYVTLRLPLAVAPLFEAWLGRHYPDRRDKILNRVRSLRGEKLNDPRFGSRMRGEGAFADLITTMFTRAAANCGLDRPRRPLSTSHFVRPAARAEDSDQLDLFGTSGGFAPE